MSKINKLVIHCADTPNGDKRFTAESIRKWHTDPPPKGRGWSDIGYHYVIELDGTVVIGRAHNGDSVLAGKEIGAHVAGHNSDSLGICLIGRDRYTVQQHKSLLSLLVDLCTQHKLSYAAVMGHRELNPGKSCPGYDVAETRVKVRDLLAGGVR